MERKRGNHSVPLTKNYHYDGTKKEAEFQSAWSTKDWDKIWALVMDASRNCILRKLIGISRTDLEELVMDATITTIRQLKDKLKYDPNYQIGKLVNVVYMPSIFRLYSKEQQFLDRKIVTFTDDHRDTNGIKTKEDDQ